MSYDFNGPHINKLYPHMPSVDFNLIQQQNITILCDVYVCLMPLITSAVEPSRK
jgi:hypothetical protein